MPIVFKGTKDGIDIWLDAEAGFEDILSELGQKLGEAKGFFTGAKTLVRFKGRRVLKEEEASLRALLIGALGEGAVRFGNIKRPAPKTVYHHGIVRSGQSISSKADLIVFGDANPGSELLAAGSIIVMGALRGLAHAGLYGDESAVVSAISLRPIQLRIADIYAILPEGEKREGIRGELAYVKDKAIRLKALSR